MKHISFLILSLVITFSLSSCYMQLEKEPPKTKFLPLEHEYSSSGTHRIVTLGDCEYIEYWPARSSVSQLLHKADCKNIKHPY